jgi:hypothetical protein
MTYITNVVVEIRNAGGTWHVWGHFADVTSATAKLARTYFPARVESRIKAVR